MLLYDENLHEHSAAAEATSILPGASQGRSRRGERGHPIRVAAVVGAPWVTLGLDDIAGIEVEAIRRYGEWRGRDVEIVACAFRDALRWLKARRVCIAIGGLADTPALAAAGDRMRYSRRPLCIGGPLDPLRACHVWGVSAAFGRERRQLEFFLHANQHYRAA